MSTHAPPKKEGRLCTTALQKLQLQRAYRLLVSLQARRVVVRRCVSCDSRVTNQNLGGFGGRSALTGPVWCLRCADFPSQLLLRLGELL